MTPPAAAATADDGIDGTIVATATRVCAQCSGPLPSTSAPTRLYCSQKCKGIAHERRRVADPDRMSAHRTRIRERQRERRATPEGREAARRAVAEWRARQAESDPEGWRARKSAANARYSAARKARLLAARPARACKQCGAPLPQDAHGLRTLCSDACRVASKRPLSDPPPPPARSARRGSDRPEQKG